MYKYTLCVCGRIKKNIIDTLGSKLKSKWCKSFESYRLFSHSSHSGSVKHSNYPHIYHFTNSYILHFTIRTSSCQKSQNDCPFALKISVRLLNLVIG